MKKHGRFCTLAAMALVLVITAGVLGCRGRQTARIMSQNEADVVGSHQAGAAALDPLVDTAVANLLTKNAYQLHPAGFNSQEPQKLRVCFVAFENRSIEELGDWRDQLYFQIEGCVNRSQQYEMINRRFVDTGLQQLGMTPDKLFLPDARAQFSALMAQGGQPVDCLLYATLTSGTTQSNRDFQRDYLMSLQLVNVTDGRSVSEQATLRKMYNKSAVAKTKQWLFF